jgi:hypothetical protein
LCSGSVGHETAEADRPVERLPLLDISYRSPFARCDGLLSQSGEPLPEIQVRRTGYVAALPQWVDTGDLVALARCRGRLRADRSPERIVAFERSTILADRDIIGTTVLSLYTHVLDTRLFLKRSTFCPQLSSLTR